MSWEFQNIIAFFLLNLKSSLFDLKCLKKELKQCVLECGNPRRWRRSVRAPGEAAAPPRSRRRRSILARESTGHPPPLHWATPARSTPPPGLGQLANLYSRRIPFETFAMKGCFEHKVTKQYRGHDLPSKVSNKSYQKQLLCVTSKQVNNMEVWQTVRININ